MPIFCLPRSQPTDATSGHRVTTQSCLLPKYRFARSSTQLPDLAGFATSRISLRRVSRLRPLKELLVRVKPFSDIKSPEALGVTVGLRPVASQTKKHVRWTPHADPCLQIWLKHLSSSSYPSLAAIDRTPFDFRPCAANKNTFPCFHCPHLFLSW